MENSANPYFASWRYVEIRISVGFNIIIYGVSFHRNLSLIVPSFEQESHTLQGKSISLINCFAFHVLFQGN